MYDLRPFYFEFRHSDDTKRQLQKTHFEAAHIAYLDVQMPNQFHTIIQDNCV